MDDDEPVFAELDRVCQQIANRNGLHFHVGVVQVREGEGLAELEFALKCFVPEQLQGVVLHWPPPETPDSVA